MLSLTTHIDTIRPAQWQRINQVSLLILIGSAAIAPAWLNIVAVAGYALMNFLGFKRLIMSVIESVLGTQPEPRQPSVVDLKAQRWAEDDTRQPRPSTGNTHKYFGDGLHSRYGNLTPQGRHGKRIDRQFKGGRK